MPVKWPFADEILKLGGAHEQRIDEQDAERQTQTVREILHGLQNQPGVVLCDEVGMGKTYVALAVAASVIEATGGRQPVVVMVPSRLRGKWQREWQAFKRHCAHSAKLDWIRDGHAHSPTEFFKLLDDDARRRRHLIFVTTGCFSGGLADPWIKLALIQLARRRTKLTSAQKRRIYRSAATLIRRKSANVKTELVEKLLHTDLDDWKRLLAEASLLGDDPDDPVPAMLTKYAHKVDDEHWRRLVAVLRNDLPKRASVRRLKDAGAAFNDACQGIYKQWLECSNWRSPLLILDEAHHAKNDETRLAKLFRDSSADDVALLSGKFQRMLFLTATPFQLGHEELIRVLRTFAAVRWNDGAAPVGDRDALLSEIEDLKKSLDRNRSAGRHLDRLWGELRQESLDGREVQGWWERLRTAPTDGFERRLVDAVDECRKTRDEAQTLLRRWLIRHNRPAHLRSKQRELLVSRRSPVVGRSILDDGGSAQAGEVGLPISGEASLAFLLTARAQGELAHICGARAYFAEGLASSYEAFHHTRRDRHRARDIDDDGLPTQANGEKAHIEEALLATEWYEERVARLVPDCNRPLQERLAHPKISATVRRAVDLWEGGEKVLVFCFYRQTCGALHKHIAERIRQRMLEIACSKLGRDMAEIDAYLGRIARRFSEPESPFYERVHQLIEQQFNAEKYQCLPRDRVIKVLAAYFRAPSFLVRYLPLDDPAVRAAFEYGARRRDIIQPGLAALERAVMEQTDRSNQTFVQRVEQFLDFAVELHERSTGYRNGAGDDGESSDPLGDCLRSVGVYSKPRKLEEQERDDDQDGDDLDVDDGAFRAAPLVRQVHGDSEPETRERLALAFNSPLFPEILVSSSVMGEGIDLHRFCRHVIHHDGYWNPSTLEQQTGRLDRIRCKAEVCCAPIVVHQPFLAGGADEKMFRVVRDRERWFQIVMGQKFQFDEEESETIAARVPLPQSLARELTFDLARWRPE